MNITQQKKVESYKEKEIQLRQLREAYYEKCLGPMGDFVFRSIDKKIPHIVIYTFPPNDDRPYWTLITGGMSDIRQKHPKKCSKDVHVRTEIIWYVKEFKPWMIDFLKGLADWPFDNNTASLYGHSMTREDLFKNTPVYPKFKNIMYIFPFIRTGLGGFEVEGDEVYFLVMAPITDSELDFKLKDSWGFLKIFKDNYDLAVFDENRKSIV